MLHAAQTLSRLASGVLEHPTFAKNQARQNRARARALDREHCGRGLRRVLRQEAATQRNLWNCSVNAQGRGAEIVSHAPSRATSGHRDLMGRHARPRLRRSSPEGW
eukprot:5006901-Alexandrium_andersonii.AAC.1